MYKIAILGCENSHANAFLDLIMIDKIYPDIEVIGVYSEDLEAANKLNDNPVAAVEAVFIIPYNARFYFKFLLPK